ncbi:MAG: O-antigen ligase family protein [Patescibacteria group bacterium]
MFWLSRINRLPSSIKIFLSLLALELLTVPAWHWPFLNIIILLLLVGLTFYLINRKAIYALYLPLIELVWGAMGHSFSYGFFNLRLVIWLVILLWFSINLLSRKFTLKIIKDRKIWYGLLIFFVIILADILLAFYYQRPLPNILYDANAYFYLLYLPIWWQVYDSRYKADIWRLLKITSAFLAVKTLMVFYVFSQGNYIQLIDFYKWLRDTRWGEITPLPDNFYRIFSQSQIYLILAWLLVWWQEINFPGRIKNIFYLVLFSAALLLSLSRSFWLGGAAAFVFLFINILLFNKKILTGRFWRVVVLVAIISFSLVLLLYNVPKYHTVNIFGFRSFSGQEPGISSRQALLSPMLKAISQAPVFGHGFGYSLTYYSSDPRIKNAANPSGITTTHAFEWGWLDMFIKGGIILVFGVLWWLILIYWRAYAIIKQNLDYLVCLAVLFGLVLIHVFSPYLNHPLGLGILMLITVIIGRGPSNQTAAI